MSIETGKYFDTSSKKINWILFLFSALTYNFWKDWSSHPNPFIQDVEQYYSYLIAFFIKHSPGFNFPNRYWLMPTGIGGYVPKMSMGLAYLYLPFFLLAHFLTWVTGGPMDGYSEIYAYSVYYGGILYVFVGLNFLRKLLLVYFSEFITSLTLLAVYMGTNLFYYTLGTSLMAHSFLFTIIVLILHFTIKWYTSEKIFPMVMVAFLCGLASVIRPSNIVVCLIPLMYGLTSKESITRRARWLYGKRGLVLWLIPAFLIPWLPQMAYWKYYTNHFLFYSYVGETFHFTEPELFNCLLSYRKGWLVYTPIMIFALAGFYRMYKRVPAVFVATLCCVPLIFYINSSWWCWWWGGSFGNRGMIDYYGLLAFPMAVSFEYLASKWKRFWFISLISLFIVYNLYQHYRFTASVLHWDSTTKESFWWGFFKIKLTDKEKEEMSKMLVPPDESKRSK